MEIYLSFLAILVAYCVFALWSSMRRPKNYPPGPDFIPWLGNATQLRKEAKTAGGQHLAFEKWSKRYNSDILGLKLGGEYVVVVLSYPLVKFAYLQEVFEGRPDNFFLRLRTMGTRQGITCTDGKLWHEHRNFTMNQMRQVGYGRSQMERDIEKEAKSLLTYIESLSGIAIWPGTFLSHSVINVLWSMTAGRRFDREDKRMKKLLDLMNRRSKLFDMAGGVLAQFPWIRFAAPEWSGFNLIKQLNAEMSAFFMEGIEQHKLTLSKENKDADFIYAYLWQMQQGLSLGNENSTFNETQLTMTILDFFIAGSQTTSTALDLIFMTLAMRQDLQNLIFNEIMANSKQPEFPHLSTKSYYPYMDAFIMEVMRFYHFAPLGGPRRALWNTKLGGYDIPKNTTLLLGLGNVLSDREHWSDPEVFRPERFIDAEGKCFKDEYFIPYGCGRRRCLGDALAKACIFSFSIIVCQQFELQLSSEREEDKPSLKLLPGITLSPKPYKIKFIKRK